jgi:medium-chain acyl-[acyl-carrier-protein] hydrolase
MRPADWMVNLTPQRQGALNLICLPFAGGGTSAFHDWAPGLGPEVNVWAARLPGRETRLAEDPYHDLNALVRALTSAVSALTTQPYAVFGHSMGALISYELVRRLRDIGRPQPVALIASGNDAPHRPFHGDQLHLLPDDRLIGALREYGATPEIFLQRPELLEVFLPMIRADFAVAETYQYRPGRELQCPIVVCRGAQDPDTTEAGCLAWQELTTGPCAQHCFDGGHFFINTARPQLLDAITGELAAGMPAGRSAAA